MAENSEWTDELKQQVVESYLAQEPTPDNTLEIVKSLAEEYGKTPNGIRLVISRAGAYVKKSVSTANGEKKKATGTRVNKAEAISELKKTIEKLNKEVDEDICDRLTGKAAIYFTSLLG